MSELLIDFAVGGTIALIAILLVNRFAKNKEISKAKYYTILVIIIMALIIFKNTYVQPKFNEWRNTNNVESELAKMEPYATLRPILVYAIRHDLLKSKISFRSK